MSKQRTRSTVQVLSAGLSLALLVMTAGLSSAQTSDSSTLVFQAAKLTASDGADHDYFGRPVSISGNTLIIGASTDDDLGDGSGSAYIFEQGAGGPGDWVEAVKLNASDGAAEDYFGGSVSISGDTVVVGAYGDDDNGSMSGSAYVFECDAGGPGNWGQVAKLTASDGEASEWFGGSVSISADTIVIGAMYDDEKGTWSGSAYIFERPITGWTDMTETKKLTASDGTSNDYFGESVSIDGDTLVVGAREREPRGSAYVFQRDEGGPDNWGQLAKLTPSDGDKQSEFAYSVSISGDVVAIGAYGDSELATHSGAVYVYERPETGWTDMTETKKLTASDGAELDFFGNCVANSGDSVLVGANWNDDRGRDAGSAYLYQRDEGGPDNWGQAAKILAVDGHQGDEFGEFVSISGATIAVGSAHDDDLGNDAGSAYVFVRSEPVAWIYLPLVVRDAP